MRRAVAGGLLLLLAACATPPPHRSAVASPIAAQFVSNATAMIGTPYHYGGAAPGGFDCSGLVVYAAAAAGLVLPRTAHQQLHAGARIERREVRGGDLVFMRLGSKELHVGIALDAQRFVHAPAAGGRVRIDLLDDAPYASGFLQARRVVGDAPAFTGVVH